MSDSSSICRPKNAALQSSPYVILAPEGVLGVQGYVKSLNKLVLNQCFVLTEADKTRYENQLIDLLSDAKNEDPSWVAKTVVESLLGIPFTHSMHRVWTDKLLNPVTRQLAIRELILGYLENCSKVCGPVIPKVRDLYDQHSRPSALKHPSVNRCEMSRFWRHVGGNQALDEYQRKTQCETGMVRNP